MNLRYVALWPVLLCLCGFQVFALRWEAGRPRVITLRVLEDGMPAGMPDRIADAAAMWASPALRIVIISQQSPQRDNGTIQMGSAQGLGRAGTRLFAADGYLRRCEIVLEQTGIQWYTGVDTPEPAAYDVWTTVGHELGHCLGLQHEDGATPSALMRAVIHGGADDVQHALSPDDVRGRDALYPPNVHVSGGCGKRAL